MSDSNSRLRKLSIGTKISIATFVLVSLIFALYTYLVSAASSSLVEQRAMQEISSKTKSVVDMIDMFDHALSD